MNFAALTLLRVARLLTGSITSRSSLEKSNESVWRSARRESWAVKYISQCSLVLPRQLVTLTFRLRPRPQAVVEGVQGTWRDLTAVVNVSGGNQNYTPWLQSY